MKHFRMALMLLLAFCLTIIASVSNAQEAQNSSSADDANQGGAIIFRTNPPAEPAFLFATSAQSIVTLSDQNADQVVTANVKIVQGKPKTVRLGINGNGTVQSVEGAGVMAWAVRSQGGARFLDVELTADAADPAITIRLTDKKAEDAQLQLTHLTPGNSVGFDLQIRLAKSNQVSPRVIAADGFMRLTDAGDTESLGFQTSTGGNLVLRLDPMGAKPLPVQLSQMELQGELASDQRSVDLQLTATAKVSQAGAKMRLLSGRIALSELPQNDKYRIQLSGSGDQAFYEVVFLSPGTFDLKVDFVAVVFTPQANWQGLQFSVAANAVVPITLRGFAGELEFLKQQTSVVPIWAEETWQAFLPATGLLDLQWKNARNTTEGKLFFTTSAKIETQVGPGLLRQDHQLEYQILQGQLKAINVTLDGPGEILDVAGGNVVGWKVIDQGELRELQITLSQPISGTSQFQVRSQTPLSAFPVRVDGLVLKPNGAIRHSGHLRISNLGSVRLTPTDLTGLTQLGPENYPGNPLEARQLFVYRFPSADYDFSVAADRIKPEINVNELVVYALAQAERIITADIELDIREAAIRDWSFEVPADYSIVSVTGASVADYIVATEATEDRRELKVIFGQDVIGRQLVSLRMEKNESATENQWTLPPILHPAAKSIRGDIGVVGAPGFRIASGATESLVEKPVSTFPNAVPNLQQAFRIRQPDWSATMQIEQLDRSIQSDLFHLYSLSQGTIYGSVLVNYFVTGAPTSQWTLKVPEDLGNVTVDGQDIRSWRREGDQLIVTLHQPVMGAYTLLLTFEQKPNEVDGAFSAGQVVPLEVQGDRGYVQIASPMQVEIDRQLVSNTLLELDPLELPAEFRLLSTAPSLGTWQYTQRPFDLQLKVKWFEPGTTASQVVEYSEANSHVSPDGELVTDVVYYVKSRGQRTLKIQLPGDPVRLWAVSVNKQPVTARQADQMTLIPLPGGADPNVPIEVSLRLGKPAIEGEHTTVTLPTVYAPVLKTQWNIEGDENYVVVNKGGTVEATRPVVWPNGFDWLAKFGMLRIAVIAFFVVLAAFAGKVVKKSVAIEGDETDAETRLVTVRPIRSTLTVTICSAIALWIAISNGWWATVNSEAPAPLQLSLPVLASGESIGIEVQNVPSWLIHFSGLGVAMLAVGLLLGIMGRFKLAGLNHPLARLVAVGLAVVGTLLQPQGAIWFFALMAVAILVYQLLPAIGSLLVGIGEGAKQWRHNRRSKAEAENAAPESDPGDSGAAGGSGVVTTLLVLALTFGWFNGTASTVHAQEAGFEAADSLQQVWEIDSKASRLTAKAELDLSGKPGDQFVLLQAPGVLTKFEGEGLRLNKSEVSGIGLAYVVSIPFPELKPVATETESAEDNAGMEDAPPGPDQAAENASKFETKTYTAIFEYQLDAINVTSGLPVLTGPATLHKVDLEFDQTGWEAECASAARIEALPTEENAQSMKFRLLLRPEKSNIVLRPRARDLSSEETRFFVEASQLYVPGPGVVDGRHRMSIRTAQGRIENLQAVVPAGLTVSSVNGPVTAWQFDAETRELNMEIDSTANANFDLVVETQRALDPLPTELELQPLRIASANGEVGLIALAFGSDAQPEKVEAESFSQVNIGDFDASLVAAGQGVIQRVFRYGVEEGKISLRVIPVAAEVRLNSRQVLSLGDERIVLSINFVAEISRTGLFQLSFPLPEGLEVESLSGDSLHHWTEITEEDERRIVMHLNGKTIGAQNFALVLAGAAPTEAGDWQVPDFQLDQAERQSGELLIRPIPGIRLRSTSRQNVSELDPRVMGGQNADQGTLAFRLLQRDWSLVLGIEKLDPWVTAQMLHEVHLREGQTKTTLIVEVNIENASIRSLPVRLGLVDQEVIKTVRATGNAVSDFVRSTSDPNVWDLQFKRRVIGRVQFQIEYERRGDRTSDSELLSLVKLPQAQPFACHFAVRTSGRLEVEAADLSNGWQRVEWNMVPSVLREAGNHNAPALALRATPAAADLAVKVIRHSLADALKLRVAEGTLTTVLSPSGDQLTAVDVTMEVIQRSSLSVQLPEGGELFSIFVNGESVNSIRQSDNANGWQFYILPGIDDRTAKVRFVYLATGEKLQNLKLVSPQLNVPLENVTWNVIAPQGYELTSNEGNLELVGEKDESTYDRQSYLSKVSGKRKDQAEQAAQLLQRASELLQAGEQSKARWALNNVANRYALDAASNEDARVQLENLQTQQAVVGLNTRRQRLFLDNKGGEVVVSENQQMLQAAAANPILQQDQLKFRPQELSQLLAGNTREDNAVLQQIAGQLVKHQRSTEPAAQAIVISLPEEGKVYRFTRGVQVAENAPLELDLQFHSQYQLLLWQWIVLGSILAVTAIGLAFTWRKG